MLSNSSFFANLVNQYVAKYNTIAERFGYAGATGASAVSQPQESNNTLLRPEQTSLPAAPAPAPAQAKDSATLAQPPVSEKPTFTTAQSEPDTFEPQTPASDSNTPQDITSKPENSTYSSSYTNLRYGLKLKFDMQAIERTVRQLSSTSNGETTTTDATLEHLFAAGFGLSSDLKISGLTVNTTARAGGAEQATGAYRQQEALQNARGLQKAAEVTKDSLPAEARQSYQVAVNRFSLRYKTDTQFSFNHFSRFQSQVTDLNSARPDAVAPYSDTAGQLAQVAPGEVVGQFFDTVDEFLENKEESLIKNSERFIEMAAQQLGLSEEALVAAKDTITGTIEGFFDSVEKSLGALEENFSQPQTLTDTSDKSATNQTPVSLDGSNLSQASNSQTEADNSLLSDLISALQPDENESANEIESPQENTTETGERDDSHDSHKLNNLSGKS